MLAITLTRPVIIVTSSPPSASQLLLLSLLLGDELATNIKFIRDNEALASPGPGGSRDDNDVGVVVTV